MVRSTLVFVRALPAWFHCGRCRTPYAAVAATEGRAWHSSGMGTLVRAAEETSWHDIPGVRILGAVIGVLLIFAALRSMFGGRR